MMQSENNTFDLESRGTTSQNKRVSIIVVQLSFVWSGLAQQYASGSFNIRMAYSLLQQIINMLNRSASSSAVLRKVVSQLSASFAEDE